MKQPDWKVPFILAGSLAVLGGFAYWLQYSHKPKQTKADTQLKKPIPLPSDDTQIIQFRIKSASGVIEGKCDSLSLKTCKVGAKGSWTITYPSNVKGDSDSIKDVLNNASTMLATDTIDLTDETPEKRKTLLDEYGLSEDKRTKIGAEFIELTIEGGKKLAAWFGEPYPLGDKVFVGSTSDGTLNDKTIFVIANFYKGVFGKPFAYFRDKTVLEFNRSDIDEIKAQTSSGKFDAVLESGGWTINGKRADLERMNSLITAFAMLKAKDFVEKDALKGAHIVLRYELKSKTNTYTVELFEKTSKDIKIKGHDSVPGESHLYVQASDLNQPVEVDTMFKTQVDKRPGELRYSLLLPASDKDTVTEVKFKGKGIPSEVDFQLNGKTWTQKDSGEKVDPTHIAKLLDTLSSEHTVDVVTPAPSVGQDAITLELLDAKNAEKAHFVVYSVKDKVYAKDLSQSANEAYALGPQEKNNFPFDFASWKVAPDHGKNEKK